MKHYQTGRSICFIVNKPVKREIFAADFRDRVVHHLIYNYISPLFEKAFINDSYSCRKGKGTHYGIKRLDHFIRSCSQNYTFSCYVLKLDIKGYFMSINRQLLYDKICHFLNQNKGKITFDLKLVLQLLSVVIFNDPTDHCIVKGRKADWKGLPQTKSLFSAEPGCGLPIGNLTSQLFGNIYLNDFDHFVKHDLGIKYYGRYVDDFVLVHRSKTYLQMILPAIKDYLARTCLLTLHPDKIYLQHYTKGIRYLGAVIKPFRNYISNRTNGNFFYAIQVKNFIARDHKPALEEKRLFVSSMNSYLGIMKHYRTYNLRKSIIKRQLSGWWWNHITITNSYSKFQLRKKYKCLISSVLCPIRSFL